MEIKINTEQLYAEDPDHLFALANLLVASATETKARRMDHDKEELKTCHPGEVPSNSGQDTIRPPEVTTHIASSIEEGAGNTAMFSAQELSFAPPPPPAPLALEKPKRPSRAKPKKEVPLSSTIAPPPPPAPIAPVVENFATFNEWYQANIEPTLSVEKTIKTCKALGYPDLRILISQPELIPAFKAALEIAKNEG